MSEQLHIPGLEPGKVDGDVGYDLPLPEPDLPTLECETAFVVYVTADGPVANPALVTGIIENREGEQLVLAPQRRAVRDDLWRCAVEIVKDVEVAEQAERVGMVMAQATMVAREMQANQQVAQQLAKNKLHVPGK